MQVLGIDVGGSGIKGAPVDMDTGTLARERLRIATPRPAKPEPVTAVIDEIVRHFEWAGPIGVTFPGVVIDGVTLSAANEDKSWVGQDARTLLGRSTGLPVTVLNDADAAGIAEMSHGAGREQRGVVIVVTFGTGIGSAIFVDGRLVPNTELGHLEMRGKDAERRASSKARTDHRLSWKKWAGRVDEYLVLLESLLSPDLIIVGGGVSRKADKFLPRLRQVRTPVVPAALANNAGIIGAATVAAPAVPAPSRKRSDGGPSTSPRSTGSRPAGARSTGTRSSGARSSGARSAGTRSTGTPSAGGRSTGGRSTASRSGGARSTGGRAAAARSRGVRSGGARSSKARSTGTPSAGGRSTASRSTASRSGGAGSTGGRAAAARSSGTRSAGARSGGVRSARGRSAGARGR